MSLRKTKEKTPNGSKPKQVSSNNIDKKKEDRKIENVVIDNNQTKSETLVDLFEIQLDDKLNFSPLISSTCKLVKCFD